MLIRNVLIITTDMKRTDTLRTIYTDILMGFKNKNLIVLICF